MIGLEHLRAAITAVPVSVRLGRVTGMDRGVVELSGLSDIASPGDLVSFDFPEGRRRAEVLAVGGETVTVLAEAGGEGLRIGSAADFLGEVTISPDNGWLGRIIDPLGQPMDDKPLFQGTEPRSVRRAPVAAGQRRPLGGRLETGLAAFNTFLPLVRGQRIGLFAGSGVGKSTLLGRLVQGVEADVVVIAMVGERGREVREFVHNILGPAGMARTVVIAATSDQPALMRRRCALTAMAVAEHFRDAGQHVLFLADSLTRYAEAHREVALAAGEAASLRGFPPSTAQAIAGLCERAGPGDGACNDITAVFSVLVAGSDMEEPVADMVRGVLDGHVVLDREIAERGRFPAVNLLRSVSRSLPAAASEPENAVLIRARALLGKYERAEMMVQAGLYQAGSDPELDVAVRLWPNLDAFLGERASDTAGSYARLATLLQQAGA